MVKYKGYEIGSTCGRKPLFFVGKGGRDLFYGIESLEKAKSLVDNWIKALPYLDRAERESMIV